MFLDFFYQLRAHGVKASSHGWLSLLRALKGGLHNNSLDGFYQVSRCILVNSEADYDGFDQAFATTFRGVEADLQALVSDLDAWLRDPSILDGIDPALAAQLPHLDLETLRRQLLERLAQQKRRHSGGNRWIGTGGTSAFGQGGFNPTGIRIGGSGGGRSALAVADARRFRAYRRDLVLDTRQISAALRRLRRLGRDDGVVELDLDATVDATARNCGDLEIVERPPRTNDVRVLLLMDVGGSMDPHAQLVSRLFSAAHNGGGFRELVPLYFHNCVYRHVYRDAALRDAVATADVLQRYDARWCFVAVGDAYMHPGELMMSGGDWWSEQRGPMGLTWLGRLAERFPRCAWLNPERRSLWRAPTIREIGRVFPMFELTLDGLTAMVDRLRHSAPATTTHVRRVAAGDYPR